jgi:hypothetical protein
MTYLAALNAQTFVNTLILDSGCTESTLGRRASIRVTILLKYWIRSLCTSIQRGGRETAIAREASTADGSTIGALAISANSTVGNRNTGLVALACLDLLGSSAFSALVDSVCLQTTAIREGAGADFTIASAIAVISTTDGTFGRRSTLAQSTRHANLEDLRSTSVAVTANVDSIRNSVTRGGEVSTADGVSIGAGAVSLRAADVVSGPDDTTIIAFLFHLGLGSLAAARVQCFGIKSAIG